MIPTDVFGEISTEVDDDKDFADMSSSPFLQRLELKSKGALIDSGKVRPGGYAIIKSSDDAVDLGSSVDILPLARRAKAIDMSDKKNVVVSYDRSSDVFASIEKRSSQQDSHCQFGSSFLVVERRTGKMYELFLGSKSNRRETGTISNYLPQVVNGERVQPQPLTLKSKHIKNEEKGYSWFVIVPTPCSNPFTKDQIPDGDLIRAEIEKFKAPAEGGDAIEVEKTPETSKRRAR